MPFSDEFIQKWEHIISDVDVTEVPLECLEKVVIRLKGNRQRTINIKKLKRQGLDLDYIEDYVNTTLGELDPNIRDVEFSVDVSMVAELVQPQTENLLKGT